MEYPLCSLKQQRFTFLSPRIFKECTHLTFSAKNFLKESGLAGRVSVRRVTDGKTHGGCREVGCLRSLGSNWDVIMIRWNVEMMGNLETAETQKSRGEGVIDIRTSQ